MATVIETFTGANGDPLPAGWTAVNGTFEIQNNKLTATGAAPGGPSWVATIPSTADGTFSVIFNAEGGASSASGVAVRGTDVDNLFFVGINSTGLTNFYRREAGVWSASLGTTHAIPAFNASTDYKISLVAVGTSLVVQIDDVDVITDVPAQTFNETATLTGVRFGDTDASLDDFTYPSPAATNTITLDIVDRQVWQDTGAGKTVTVSGTASTANVEYQLDGGAWTTGGATTTNNYSFNVALTRGNHDLSVRCAEDTAITATATKIGVLDVFNGAGQSNMSGFGAPSQTFSANGDFDCTLLGNDDVYKLMVDPWDSNAGQIRAISSYANAAGSWMVHFANQYVLDKSESLCVVPNSIGGTGLDRWQKTDSTRVGGLNLYEAMAERIALTEGCKTVFLHGGETNIVAGMTKATFKTLLNQFVDDVFADFGVKTWIVAFGNLTKDGAYDGNGVTTGQIPLRAAQVEVAAENANAEITQPLDDIDLSNEDGLHFQTTPILTDVGTRVYQSYAGLVSTINLSITGITDGPHRIVIVDNSTTPATVIHDDDVSFTSEAGTIPTIPLAVGVRWFGLWFGDNAPTDGSGITGVTV